MSPWIPLAVLGGVALASNACLVAHKRLLRRRRTARQQPPALDTNSPSGLPSSHGPRQTDECNTRSRRKVRQQ